MRRALSLLSLTLLLSSALVAAAPQVPRVIEVPARPAFTRLAGSAEKDAHPGQWLPPESMLRTQTPGRLQVQLAHGRSFRLGGDAVVRLRGDELELEKGRIIAWVNPGSKGGAPLRIRTRVATASIVGTTVFIEATKDKTLFLSWEGKVRIDTDQARSFELMGGQAMAKVDGIWQLPHRLSPDEARQRRSNSLLFQNFTAPMQTLPQIDHTFGFAAADPAQ